MPKGFLSRWRCVALWMYLSCFCFHVEGTTTIELTATANVSYLEFSTPQNDTKLRYVSWRITSSDPNKKVTIDVLSLNSGNLSDCIDKKLCIYDGYNYDGPRVDLCGQMSSLKETRYKSSCQHIYLSFDLQGSVMQNFKIQYTSSEEDFNPWHHPGPICPGQIMELEAHYDPSYLYFPIQYGYPNHFVVGWRISSYWPDRTVEISIQSQNLMYATYEEFCTESFLTVYDGFDSNATKLAILCGYSTSHDQPSFRSSSQYLFLQYSNNQYFLDKGFLVKYRSKKIDTRSSPIYIPAEACNSERVHPRRAFVSETYLTSLNFPEDYPSYCSTKWRMSSFSKDYVVSFTVRALDIEKSENCKRDSLTFYDGNDTASPILQKLCGTDKENVHIFTSTSDSVFIHFVSDRGNAGHGFVITFRAENSKKEIPFGLVGGLVGLGTICLVFAICLLWRKRRNRKQRPHQHPTTSKAIKACMKITCESQPDSVYMVKAGGPPPYTALYNVPGAEEALSSSSNDLLPTQAK